MEKFCPKSQFFKFLNILLLKLEKNIFFKGKIFLNIIALYTFNKYLRKNFARKLNVYEYLIL